VNLFSSEIFNQSKSQIKPSNSPFTQSKSYLANVNNWKSEFGTAFSQEELLTRLSK